MKSHASWLAGVIAVSAILTSAPVAAELVPGYHAVVRLGVARPPSLVPEEPGLSAKKRTATIVVTYVGFSAPAKAAFQRAVNIWETKLSSPVTIRVQAQWADLGNPLILGQAGPVKFFRCPPNCPPHMVANTWYPIAIANKLKGADLDPGAGAAHADIQAQFNNTFQDWSFAAQPAPAGKIDFTSVVLHELGHGLGFIGSGTLVNGGTQGTVRSLDGTHPTIYDRFTANAAKTKLITFPDPSVQLKNLITGNSLFFQVNATKRFKLFAPATFQPGSSYSHLDEDTYPEGNANSLMTPVVNYGETIRNPGPATTSIFNIMGW